MLSPNRLLLIILCGAFVLRAVVAIGVQRYIDNRPNRQFLIEGDAWGYWELGRKLANGDAYEIHQPPRRVSRMPGFPMLLAVCMKVFGENAFPIRIVLAAVGAAACFLVFLLGRELFDERTGVTAAAIAAISPAMVGFAPLVLSETLFAACLVLSVWCMTRLVTNETCTRWSIRAGACWLMCGAAVAVACYVRPSWLLAAPLFALVLLIRWPDKKLALACGATVLAGTALTLTPWIIRNFNVTDGKLVVTTLWLGPSLYDGFNPDANGDSDMTFFDRDSLSNSMSEYDVNRHYTRLALEYAAAHPLHSLRLTGAKVWRFWKPWPNADQFRSWWMLVAVGGFFLPVLVLALLGAWTVRHRPWAWLLTLGPLVYFSILHMIFVGSLRYRLPAEYPMCVLSAVGLLSLLRISNPKGP